MKRSLALGLAIAAALLVGAARAEEPPRPPAPPRRDGPPPPPRPDGGSTGAAPRVPGAGDIVTIKGRIVNDSGNPLPARLTMEVRGEFPGTEKRLRDAPPPAEDGTFTVDNLLNGRKYEIIVASSGLTTWTTAFAAGAQDAVVHLTTGRWTDGTLRGTVLGTDGKAVGAGVTVSAGMVNRGWCGTRGPGFSSATKTRADGTFVLEFLSRSDFTVAAWFGEEPSDFLAEAFLIPEGSSEVVLRLAPIDKSRRDNIRLREPSPHRPATSAITGRLLTSRGSPLPEEFLICARREGTDEDRVFYPSSQGFFDTGTLAPGKWSLKAKAPSGLIVGETKEVESGTRDLQIRLDSGGTIQGTVVYADGKPVGAGLQVVARIADLVARDRPGGHSVTRTRDDGSFLIEYLEGTAFTVLPWPYLDFEGRGTGSLGGPVVRGVAPGSVDIALHLVVPVVARGFLKDVEGKPVPEVEIHAYSEECESRARITTDKDGAFSFYEVPAGRVRLYTGKEDARVELGEAVAPFKDLVLKVPAK